MKIYEQWYDLVCPYHQKKLVLLKPGKWVCEIIQECGVYDFNNLTYCKGFYKECDVKIVAQNELFPTKEDLYCENCIQDYLLEKEHAPPTKIIIRYCTEKDCDGVVEYLDSLHICTTCGVIQESEKEIHRKYLINRMKMIHSKKDLSSRREFVYYSINSDNFTYCRLFGSQNSEYIEDFTVENEILYISGLVNAPANELDNFPTTTILNISDKSEYHLFLQRTY
jgi:hypothetical protein